MLPCEIVIGVVGWQEAVGAHRVAVGMVVAALLWAGAACIDSVVPDSELLLQVLPIGVDPLSQHLPSCQVR
jgi:hypothetical protein